MKRKRGGIFLRAFALSFTISALVIGIFAVITFPKQKQAIIKSLEARAVSVASSITTACENAVIPPEYELVFDGTMRMISKTGSLEPEEVEIITDYCLSVLQKSPDILYILIVHNNGFTLVQTPEEWERRAYPDPNWAPPGPDAPRGRFMNSPIAGTEVYHYSHPMAFSGLHWGWMHMGLSLDSMKAELNRTYLLFAGLSVVCLLVAALGSYLFARSLSRPVLSLLATTKRVGQGELGARAREFGRHELGELAASFNEMAEKLEESTVSRAFLNDIIRNMSECLLVADGEGRIRLVNPALVRLSGWSEEELLMKPLDFIFEKERRDLVDRIFEKGAERNVERVMVARNGERVPVLFSGSVLESAAWGRGLVCLALNIAERKRTEEDLKKAYEELQRTQAQLVQTAKLASIGELAAGIAHELNQPLMVLRTTVQFFRRSWERGQLTPDRIEKQFSPLEKNTERMMRIIENLRTFSRRSQTHTEAVDVNQAVEECFLMVGEQLRVRGIEVETRLAPDLPRVAGNANQLEQVFLNLITNARDALESAPGDRKKLLFIETRTLAGGFWVEILVRDTGTGILREVLPSVFDPFFTTKDVGEGTGLGLSISYGIVKEHGGSIEVGSTGPGGTVFRVRLPAEKQTNGVA